MFAKVLTTKILIQLCDKGTSHNENYDFVFAYSLGDSGYNIHERLYRPHELPNTKTEAIYLLPLKTF